MRPFLSNGAGNANILNMRNRSSRVLYKEQLEKRPISMGAIIGTHE